MSDLVLDYPLVQRQLDNGLTVIVNPDPTSPAVALNIWYHVGSADEDQGASGFAHLFEHLMFQGSANVAPSEHLAAVQAMGGTANATTSFDRTNYFEKVPPHALELALWLEADRLASLDVSEENLRLQRDVVKEEKRQRYDNVPYGDLLQLMLGLNFPEHHPYSHPTIGSMADLDAATLDQVRDFWERWYRPSNASLVLSGDVTPDRAFELVDRYFGAIDSGPAPLRPTPQPLAPHQDEDRLTVRRAVPLDILALSWRTPPITDAAHLAVDHALAILAGSQSSRLQERLVRQLELAEDLVASDLALAGGTSLALLTARPREGHSLEELEDALLTELAEMAEAGPTQAEVDRINALTEREWLSELAPCDSRADHFNEAAVLTGDATLANRRLARITELDIDQLREATASWLAPEQRTALYYLREGNIVQ